jgi:hypothetical protein
VAVRGEPLGRRAEPFGDRNGRTGVRALAAIVALGIKLPQSLLLRASEVIQ